MDHEKDISGVEYGEFDDESVVEKSEPQGCWGSFTGCIGGMWATRQMTSSKDREIYVRTTLRELVVYVVFLIILCILTFGMTSSTMFYYTNVMEGLFLDKPYNDTRNTLRGSSQMLDFWRFCEYILLESMYWEYWYDDALTPTIDNNILFQNRLLGAPRFRQLRVRDDSCVVHENFKAAIKQCYDVYSEGIEDTKPFGPGNSSEWLYHTSDELDGNTHWAKLTTYSGAGSIKDLSTLKRNATNDIAHLRNNRWIDRATRAVFLDFTVYNANVNLFCVVKIVFEFPATGGLIPSWSFRTVKLLRYVTVMDYFIMACEFIFVFFIIYYMVEELIEIKHNGCAYFRSVWNMLDLLVIVISIICIAFSIFRYITVQDKIKGLLEDDEMNRYANFEFLGYWQTRYNDMVAVCVFFAWIKIFKYISFNKTMTQLSSTLSRCAKDVAGFAIMFFIVFFAFAQLGYLLFGTQVHDFRTFGDSVFTLLRTILGDFNFHEIESANRILGPIFFLSYVFFVFFVLLNMFLAIINDTYSEVKAEIALQKNEFEIADYFKRGYNNMMGKLGRRDRLVDLENALKLSDANADGVLTFDELRNNLKNHILASLSQKLTALTLTCRCNFSDMEIEMCFARYDTDGDRVIGENEKRAMLADIEGRRLELDQEIKKDGPESRPVTAKGAEAAVVAGAISEEEFQQLQRRVDRMEGSIGSIVNKIDAVLVKLDTMEKTKGKRRENMSKFLDSMAEDGGKRTLGSSSTVQSELPGAPSDTIKRSQRLSKGVRMQSIKRGRKRTRAKAKHAAKDSSKVRVRVRLEELSEKLFTIWTKTHDGSRSPVVSCVSVISACFKMNVDCLRLLTLNTNLPSVRVRQIGGQKPEAFWER
ncbi:unnamed protein product [Cyprideis torosa]|uniref:Uncharacterized protein n=1 Tax=Cyprideis torosa TaxID=163714 RepID=A0A7R8WBM1_9CRUS|nr:unnamed protein product [Cyprideis torosa]CAG0892278.1 unnamed protein product [Cyprideis torosa]